MSHYTRLRQICLVAHDLDKTVDELCSVFDIRVCHRDPNVAKYGLVNALMPIGTSFIEVVSPTIPGPSTAAGRYLERRGGDGGYMVINDCDNVARYRDRAAALGIRCVEDRAYPGKADLLQLHPADTGGAILEFDHHIGGTALNGAYHWAGPDWQRHVRTTRVSGISGVALQAKDPGTLAQQWNSIFGSRVNNSDSDPKFDLDNATLRFVPDGDGCGDGIVAVDIVATDRAAIVAAAAARGMSVRASSERDYSILQICRVVFRLFDDVPAGG